MLVALYFRRLFDRLLVEILSSGEERSVDALSSLDPSVRFTLFSFLLFSSCCHCCCNHSQENGEGRGQRESRGRTAKREQRAEAYALTTAVWVVADSRERVPAKDGAAQWTIDASGGQGAIEGERGEGRGGLRTQNDSRRAEGGLDLFSIV